MKKNNNNSNNIFDIIPFSLKSFSLSQFKLILQYHCHFNIDRPYITNIKLHIYDCNKNSLGWDREIELYFNTPLDVDHPAFDLYICFVRDEIIKVCTGWENEFAHILPNPDLYYLEIIDCPDSNHE